MKKAITKPALRNEWLRNADEIAEALRLRAEAENHRRVHTPISGSVEQMDQLWKGAPVGPPARRKTPR